MADVDSVVYTTTERKVRKVKKTTKRRESHDQNAEVTITEVDSTQNNHHAIEEYVLAADVIARINPQIISLLFLLLFVSLPYQLSVCDRATPYSRDLPPRGTAFPHGSLNREISSWTNGERSIGERIEWLEKSSILRLGVLYVTFTSAFDLTTSSLDAICIRCDLEYRSS